MTRRPIYGEAGPAQTKRVLPMTIEEWLRAATADAERRQLAELTPRLVALAEATRQLRTACWNREAVVPDPAPPAPEEP